MVTNSIYVRAARFEDLPYTEHVVKLVNDAFNTNGGWTNTTHIVDGERTNSAEIEKLVRENAILLAFDGATVIGSVRAAPPTEDGKSFISTLAVLPAYQSKGVGKRLMAAAFDHMRETGATKAALTSFDNRPEILGWYMKLGFVIVTDKIPFNYPGIELKIPTVCLVAMEKPL